MKKTILTLSVIMFLSIVTFMSCSKQDSANSSSLDNPKSVTAQNLKFKSGTFSTKHTELICMLTFLYLLIIIYYEN